jgi:hypothetical protein
MNKAENRWKQNWLYVRDKNDTNSNSIVTNFNNVYDDISMAFWDNKK